MIGLPELDLHDGEALGHAVIVNETSDVLGRGVDVHDKNRLCKLPEEGQGG